MLRFTTISPTHIEGKGKKQKAWDRYLDGSYVAIGWLGDIDLTGKSPSELMQSIEKEKYKNEKEAKDCLSKFLFGLSLGDYIAVNNVNHGLFGVGRITSRYKFKYRKHNAGDEEAFYSHYRRVRWLETEYTTAAQLLRKGEAAWRPRGTMGAIYDSVPAYIMRLPIILRDVERMTAYSSYTSGEKPPKKGSSQGFSVDPIVRSAVEDHAVALAISHYESLGYTVKEEGKPYDLLCTKGNKKLFVEVKGSQTTCEEIILTPNEVSFADANRGKMQLFVLSGIAIHQTADDCTASGGKKHVLPWMIERKFLRALSYSYRLPDIH